MIEKVNKLVEIMITTVQMYQEAEERTDIDNELIDKALDAALEMPLFEDIDEEAKILLDKELDRYLLLNSPISERFYLITQFQNG